MHALASHWMIPDFLLSVPWELYLALRPRGTCILSLDITPDKKCLHDIAVSKLRTAKFFYLTISILMPLLGASLLHYVGMITGAFDIGWFSTIIFVLVTGVQPWHHLRNHLCSRTEELGVIHTFRVVDGVEDIQKRIAHLEGEIVSLKVCAPHMHCNLKNKIK